MDTRVVIRLVSLFVSLHFATLRGQDLNFGFRGQWVNWSNFNFSDNFYNQWGTRYIPTLSGSYSLNEQWEADLVASANLLGTLTVADWKFAESGQLRPYRLWMRLSSSQFELRAGLQKISFGSASMLRPLMWFDQIDPRDPLQLTDGVYAILARYYFLNNTNIWLWGLYGNKENRGWDISPSDRKIPEFGGRLQLPFGPGEFALSYHHRETAADSLAVLPGSGLTHFPSFTQDRIAVDGKWDLGTGIGFEYVLERNHDAHPVKPWVNQFATGLDYTFGIGNGLGFILEHLLWSQSSGVFRKAERVNFSAISLSYPTGPGDMITGMVYYNWTGREWYRFIGWEREFQYFSLHIMAYWNPDDRFNLYPNAAEGNLFSGKGLQLMIELNH